MTANKSKQQKRKAKKKQDAYHKHAAVLSRRGRAQFGKMLSTVGEE